MGSHYKKPFELIHWNMIRGLRKSELNIYVHDNSGSNMLGSEVKNNWNWSSTTLPHQEVVGRLN